MSSPAPPNPNSKNTGNQSPAPPAAGSRRSSLRSANPPTAGNSPTRDREEEEVEKELQNKRQKTRTEIPDPNAMAEDDESALRGVTSTNFFNPISDNPNPTPPRNSKSTSQAPPPPNAVSKLMERIRRNNDKLTPSTPTPGPPPSTNPTPLPTPKHGWPKSIGRTSGHLLSNLNWQQLGDWVDPSTPFVLIAVLGHGTYPAHISAEIAAEISNAIKEYANAPEVTVFAPIPENTPTKINQAPYAYLARDITEESKNLLLTQRVWNTPRISFIAFIEDSGSPTHIGSIDGYNVKEKDEYRSAGIRVYVKEQLFTHVGALLAEALETHQSYSHLSPEDRVSAFLEETTIEPITVTFTGDKSMLPGRTIWNILLPQPIDDDDAWLNIVQATSRIDWTNPSFGPGIRHGGWNCSYCHSTNHPLGLCQFLKIEGWIKSRPIPSVESFNRVHEMSGWKAYHMDLEELQFEIRKSREALARNRGRGGPNRTRGRGGGRYGSNNQQSFT